MACRNVQVAAAGIVPSDEIERAQHEPVPDRRKPMPILAPHAADAAVDRGMGCGAGEEWNTQIMGERVGSAEGKNGERHRSAR